MSTWKRTSPLTGLFCVPRQIVAWHYMKILHLCRENELFKINFEFKWKNRATKDPQPTTSVMLNIFWVLISKKLLLSLFLTSNIKLDGMPTNIKLKRQACFTLYFKFWEVTSVKSYKIQLPILLFLVLHQQISFFTTF